jgi:DNA-binding protein YbaB
MDQSGLGVGDIDRLLEDTRRALSQIGARQAGESDQDGMADVRGSGTAADDQVRASVATGGRLETLTVDPRLMRIGSEALCEQIVVAVNAALDDLRTKVAASTPELPDKAALGQQLDEIRTESVRRMEMFTQGVADAVAQITQAAEGRHGR